MGIDSVVKNGKLVIPKCGIIDADIAIEGEKIVQIGRHIPGQGKVIDAKGKHVFPGCIDTHTHHGHFNEFYDEMESESKCLAFAGVTTSVVLLDRCIKNMEGWKEKTEDPELFVNSPGMSHPVWKASYKKILPEAIEKCGKVSTNDFAFHLLIGNCDQIKEIPDYHREFGICSFKFWTGLGGPAALPPSEMWLLFKMCNEEGVLPYVNTVNSALQNRITQEVEELAKTDKRLKGPFLVKKSRPAIVETLDLQTTLWLAKEVGVQELLIAHTVSKDSVKLIRHFRREYGLNVMGEACVPWLSFWWPEVEKELGHIATSITPQLGDKKDVDSLWDGIRTGDIPCIGTDGMVPPREKYCDGKPNPLFQPAPTKDHPGLGFPSHMCLFPVVLHMGMERGFSLVEIAEISSYHPARVMRLFPKKGTIAVGSDADLVIMDLGMGHILKKEELHSVSPFCPWEGWVLNCWPVLTMLRGQVIFEDGKLIKEKTGKYLSRHPRGKSFSCIES